MTSIETGPGESAPGEIMFLPAGPQVSAVTARLLQSDLEELLDRSVKPCIDFDHSGQAAAVAWRFVWP